MKLKLFSHCGCCVIDGKVYDCGGYDYIVFTSRPFQFRWFDDNGEWFVYVHVGRRYWRWSGAGYMRGRVSDTPTPRKEPSATDLMVRALMDEEERLMYGATLDDVTPFGETPCTQFVGLLGQIEPLTDEDKQRARDALRGGE